MKLTKIVLVASSISISLLFIFMKHYIELAITIETWILGKGLTLHKDFVSFQFPLIKMGLLQFYNFFGWNFKVEPFFGLFTGLLSLLIIYLIGKRYFSQTATILSLIFFSIFFWFFATGIQFYHEQVIGLLLVYSLLILFQIINENKFSTKKVFFLGILLSLSVLSGQIASITVGVFALITVISIYKKYIKGILPFFLGLFIPVFLMVIYYISKNALSEFIHWNIIYYFTYAGYNKNFPIDQIKNIVIFYLPLLTLTAICIFFKSARKYIWKSKYLIIMVLAISTIPFNLLSVFHYHHLSYSLPILAIAVAAVYDLTITIKGSRTLFTISSIIFLWIFISSIIPWYKNHLIYPPNMSIANDVQKGDNQDKTIQWIRNNTNPNQKIMVFGDSMTYVRADRLPSARPANAVPYGWEPFSSVKKELEENLPDYWIIDEQFLNRFIKNYDKQEMVSFLNEKLSSCYQLTKIYPLWQIWKRSCKL